MRRSTREIKKPSAKIALPDFSSHDIQKALAISLGKVPEPPPAPKLKTKLKTVVPKKAGKKTKVKPKPTSSKKKQQQRRTKAKAAPKKRGRGRPQKRKRPETDEEESEDSDDSSEEDSDDSSEEDSDDDPDDGDDDDDDDSDDVGHKRIKSIHTSYDFRISPETGVARAADMAPSLDCPRCGSSDTTTVGLQRQQEKPRRKCLACLRSYSSSTLKQVNHKKSTALPNVAANQRSHEDAAAVHQIKQQQRVLKKQLHEESKDLKNPLESLTDGRNVIEDDTTPFENVQLASKYVGVIPVRTRFRAQI